MYRTMTSRHVYGLGNHNQIQQISCAPQMFGGIRRGFLRRAHPLAKSFAGPSATHHREVASETFNFDVANSIQMSLVRTDAILHRYEDSARPTRARQAPRTTAPRALGFPAQRSAGRFGKCVSASRTTRQIARSSNSKMPTCAEGVRIQHGACVCSDNTGVCAP